MARFSNPVPWLCVGILYGSVAACATAPKANIDDFQYRATQGPLALYWNCRKDAGSLTLEGIAIQIHYPSITRDLKIVAEGVDGRGAIMSRGTAATRDAVMHQMEQNPFQLTVQTLGSESRFNLEYTYWLHVVASGQDSDNDEHDYTVKNICPSAGQVVR